MAVAINLLAVLVSAIASMVIGMIWYSPSVFGKVWMKESKIGAQKKKGMAKAYVIHFIGALVTAYVLSAFVKVAGATTASQGAFVGFLAWAGFIATTTLGIVLWERKSWKLYFLNNCNMLLTLAVMGAILAVWM